MTTGRGRSIGSSWRRWDLHVHTPASVVHNYGGSDPWDRFLSDLAALPPELSVLGINDYLFIDGYRRVLAEWQQDRFPKLEALFPVVEFRLEQLAGVDGELSRINYHVIFSSGLDPDVIDAQFLHGLAAKFHLAENTHGEPWSGFLSRENVTAFGAALRGALPPDRAAQHPESDLQLGFANLVVSLQDLRQLLQHTALAGKTLCAIGKTEWSRFRWTDQSIASKKDLINGVDLIFTAAPSAAAYHDSRQSLVRQGVNSKLLDCSDAHDYLASSHKDRLGNTLTWIRAQPTLAGLKHALTEFDHRVFVGDEPRKLVALRSRPSEHIQAVRVTRAPDAPEDAPVLFDTSVEMNPGFVAVVGNKGKGKSALLDVIGLAGNSSAERNFTFLSSERFRNPRANRAAEHRVFLTWCDGEVVERRLDEHVTAEAPERVTYLPQRLLDEICSADPGEPAEKFARQLGQVLFAHVPHPDRLGCSSLDGLIATRSQAIDERLQGLRAELRALNHEIADTERRTHPHRRSAVEQRLELLRRKLNGLLESEPVVPEKPPESADPDIAARIEDLRERIRQQDDELSSLQQEDSDLAIRVETARQLQTALETLAERIETFRGTHSDEAALLGLSLDDLLTFVLALQPLHEVLEAASRRRSEIALLLDATRDGGPASLRQTLESELSEAIGLLDQAAREHAAAVARHEEWKRSCLEVTEGSTEEPGITPTEAELEAIRGGPATLVRLRGERQTLVRRIHNALLQKVAIYQELYRPARDFIDGHPLARVCDLAFGASLRERNLEPRLFEILSRGVAGTFTGLEEGSEALRSRTAAIDFSSTDDVVAFVDALDSALHQDERSSPPSTVDPERALRTGHTLQELYDLVFGLGYLEPYHSLHYQGTVIDQLSPGEKGTLLLMFYLLVDPGRTPLLLDQPDENLDNHTIKDLLVPAIKEAAGRRQVIVVTHNPNVAIVADADQIVVAHRDGDAFGYRSGAIEDAPINLDTVDVLEGTWPALDNRTLKYQRPGD